MSSVYLRKYSNRPGVWWVAFTGPDGKRYCKSTGCRTEAEARQVLDQVLAKVAKMEPSSPPPQLYTVAQWTAAWAEKRIAKGRWTNAKLDARALDQHVAGARIVVHGAPLVLGKLRLDVVRTIHIRAWLESMEPKKLAANTVISIYNLLSRAFDAAVREELIETTPCQLERGELPRLSEAEPSGRPEEAMFSLRELEQLISDRRIPLDRRLAYAIGCLGGIREGEISALTWADYDTNLEPLHRLYVSKSYTRRNKRVKSTKNEVARWVPVHRAVAALLAEWSLHGWEDMLGRKPTPEDLLVPNREGRHLTDLNLWGNLQHDLKVLGWEHRRFHDTRATFTTYAVAGGASWELVKHITHGVKRRSRRMAEVYIRPPWEVLCGLVQGIKLQLRGEAVLIPLAATGTQPAETTQPPVLRRTATIEEARMEVTATTTADPSAQGEIRTRPQVVAGRREPQGSHGSAAPGSTGGRREVADRSASATIRRLRPLVGGRARPFRKSPKGGES